MKIIIIDFPYLKEKYMSSSIMNRNQMVHNLIKEIAPLQAILEPSKYTAILRDFISLLKNPILDSDSYKGYNTTQYNSINIDGKHQRLTGLFASMGSRVGAKHQFIVAAGIQKIAEYLVSTKIVEEIVVTETETGPKYELKGGMISDAKAFYDAHIGPGVFDPIPWIICVIKYGGTLPIEMCALPEGTLVRPGTPIVTIRNTDRECASIVPFIEATIQSIAWYMTTVATLSFSIRMLFSRFLSTTCAESPETISTIIRFMLHDFGRRGASSEESAIDGARAHLYVFDGSDTTAAIENVGGRLTGFSVRATEHNLMMSLLREGELLRIRELIKALPRGEGRPVILSLVVDTFDAKNCIRHLCTTFLGDIMSLNMRMVVRLDSVFPDAKDVADTVVQTFLLMESLLPKDLITVNAKGFKVLDTHWRVLYGDGLDPEKIEQILVALVEIGWSVENMVFGMGGGLLQKPHRDVERFALKVSEVEFDVTDPVTGDVSSVKVPIGKETPGKESDKGRYGVYEVDGIPTKAPEGTLFGADGAPLYNMLQRVTCNGNYCVPMKDPIKIKEMVNAEGARMCTLAGLPFY